MDGAKRNVPKTVGTGKAGPGRKKGIPNRSTTDMREAIAAVLHGAAPRLALWLDAVAAKDPSRALDIVTRLAEYHIPRLARQEITGQNGEPLKVEVINFQFPAEWIAPVANSK